MSESLVEALAAYAAAVTLFSLGTAALRRPLGRAHAGAAVVLGAAAALDALVAVVGVVAGGRPEEAVPFAGYLLLSVLAVPAGWAYASSSRRGWDAAIFALATGALSVICVRLGRTWG